MNFLPKEVGSESFAKGENSFEEIQTVENAGVAEILIPHILNFARVSLFIKFSGFGTRENCLLPLPHGRGEYNGMGRSDDEIAVFIR
jgi:hypothetical protein